MIRSTDLRNGAVMPDDLETRDDTARQGPSVPTCAYDASEPVEPEIEEEEIEEPASTVKDQGQ